MRGGKGVVGAGKWCLLSTGPTIGVSPKSSDLVFKGDVGLVIVIAGKPGPSRCVAQNVRKFLLRKSFNILATRGFGPIVFFCHRGSQAS